MAGMKIVPVKCDDEGNIDLKDLEKQAIMNTFELSCIMITYPSTHGVFEPVSYTHLTLPTTPYV